jgi:RNA-directed DNA polymerase
VLVALARQEEKKRAAQARSTATPGMSRPPNVSPSPWGAPRAAGPQPPPIGPATAPKSRQPWYVTALVILLAVMLTLALRPGGAVVAGVMLYVYFRWFWKR